MKLWKFLGGLLAVISIPAIVFGLSLLLPTSAEPEDEASLPQTTEVPSISVSSTTEPTSAQAPSWDISAGDVLQEDEKLWFALFYEAFHSRYPEDTTESIRRRIAPYASQALLEQVGDEYWYEPYGADGVQFVAELNPDGISAVLDDGLLVVTAQLTINQISAEGDLISSTPTRLQSVWIREDGLWKAQAKLHD